MVAAHYGPLEQRPYVLYGVRVNLAPRPFLVPMLYRFMLGVLIRNTMVGRPFVRVDSLGISGGVLSNEAVQGLPVGASNDLQTDVPAPLHGSYHDCLVALVAASLAFYFPAHKSLVYLYDALQELG